MKKWASLMLALVIMVGSLTGCGSKKNDNTQEEMIAAMEALNEAQELLEEAEKLKEEMDAVSVDKEESDAAENIVEEEIPEEVETEAEPEEDETEAPEEEEPKNQEKLIDGMRPEFKEAMDSYEDFMDEYVAFMKKYNKNPSDLSLLMDYADYMGEYAEFVEDFEKWDDEEMNTAEMEYYIEVQARVSKKLLEVIK